MPPDPLQFSHLLRSFAPTTHELAVPIQNMLRGPCIFSLFYLLFFFFFTHVKFFPSHLD